MEGDQSADFTRPSDGERGPRDVVDRDRVVGLATVLVGASQLPLAFALADRSTTFFVIGSGGWLLIAIGTNLLQGREAFETGWTDSETIRWLTAVATFLLALVVVAAVGIAVS